MVHIADSVSVDAPGVSSILWLGRSVSSAYSIPQLMRTFMCMLLAFSAQDTRTVQPGHPDWDNFTAVCRDRAIRSS